MNYTTHKFAQYQEFIPQFLLGILFVINAFIFWPGQMTPDSVVQYKTALTGLYIDFHPPMISVLWRFLDKLYPGSGLLFLFHLLLFYFAAGIFTVIFKSSKFRWFYAILPLIPPLCFYSSMLWKDIAFTFSYLCVAALLSFFMVTQKKPSLIITMIMLALLFYGTGAKFQAMYIAPLFLLGFCTIFNKYQLTIKTIFYTVITSVVFLTSLTLFNNYLVPAERQGHGWQLVKLYDLAAISLDTQQPIFPDFILKNPDFSLARVQEEFNYEMANDMVSCKNPPLIVGANDEQRQLILQTWCHAVLAHPIFYMKHRLKLLFTMLNNHPLKKLESLDFSQYKGLSWFAQLQKPCTSDNKFSAIMCMIACKILLGLLWLIRFPLKTIFIVPFLIFYFLLGLLSLRNTQKYALPLTLMSGAGLLLLFIMLFFSMASTIRYALFTICMFNACHGFAYTCFRSRKTPRSTIMQN